MPYLLQVGIDKSFRLKRNVHFFEFQGVRFKFVQHNPLRGRKYPDALLTIVDDYNIPSAQQALTVAGYWSSALVWQTKRPIAVHVLGGASWPAGLPLRRARCNIFGWPRLPFYGDMRGIDIYRIARTTTDDQRRALTLFREAQASNSVLLPILLHWQILEVGTTQPIGWIDKALRSSRRLYRVRELTAQLQLGGRRLGEYLQDECRHAIAHITRKPGRRRLKFDDLDESRRLGVSGSILEELAIEYIEQQLGVRETLWLVRPARGGFPRYLDQATKDGARYRTVFDK